MLSKFDQLKKRLSDVECSDSTWFSGQIIFEKANGSKIWDSDGNEYIDLCAGFGVMALGHASETYCLVLKDFLDSGTERKPIVHGMGDVYPSVAKIELLDKLKQLLPAHFKKGGLALSGSQAVEFALKTAIISSKKSGFISFEGSYHGLDLGVLPVTSRSDFRSPFLDWFSANCQCGRRNSILANNIELPFECSRESLESAIDALEKIGLGCAAVIIEPVQGRAGVRIPSEEWLAMLREVTESKGVFLIFDEVFSGLGRIGTFCFSEKIPSDIVCIGKALGGGFPISAVFGTEEAMTGWPQNMGEAIHTGTFFGHPFSCSMALATIQTIESQNLCERSRLLGEKVLIYLRDRLKNNKSIRDIRGLGLMIAIEFDKAGMGAELMTTLKARGIIVLPSGERGESISITPALNIQEKLLFEAIDNILSILN